MSLSIGRGFGLLRSAHERLSELIDRRVGWYRLPRLIGLAVLVGVRNQLRRHNLADTEQLPRVPAAPPARPPDPRRWRTADGSFNDLAAPRAGMAGSRFGRNIPLEQIAPVTDSSVLEPDPRAVSTRLLGRPEGGFQPAETLNLLAAAWIQFMVRDWVSHGRGDLDRAFHLPVLSGDRWPEPDIVIPRTVSDTTRPDPAGAPPTFTNVHSHWWDLSSLYGDSPAEQHAARSSVLGRLHVPPPGGLPRPNQPGRDPASEPGFWTGLALMGTLFVLEHNAICDALHAVDPELDDEQLFQQARLINAALVAKIHTVEWTPAIINHPITVSGMRANWYGLVGQRFSVPLRGLVHHDLLTGIPGSHAQQFDVPYSLTEEFVAVYRMHPLIPDDYQIRSHLDHSVLEECTFRDMAGPATWDLLARRTTSDLLYTFGTAHPGALSLRNFPRLLQEFQRPDNGRYTDLAATDIIRSREAGIPRYNAFRRLLRLRPAADFDELSDDAEVLDAMRELYRDIEQVDLLVGSLAEQKPPGFAFGDTAFRIFLLMATRRLNSDRFFTDDYTTATYTPLGLHWIESTTMSDVLLRHFPTLRPVLREQSNAFAPWPRA